MLAFIRLLLADLEVGAGNLQVGDNGSLSQFDEEVVCVVGGE